MKFHLLVRYAFALTASLFLATCGGGGASTNPDKFGDLVVSPPEGTFFAGVLSTITVSGGRAPYSMSSSEPTVITVPNILNGHNFDVVPNNPGTVDAGLPPGSLPIRTVNIQARDVNGVTATAKIHVAHNFLTGYDAFFSSTTCTDAAACAGGETVVIFDTVTNGLLYGNRPFRVEIVRGDCKLADPLGSSNLSTSVNTASDHEGKVMVVVRCPAGIASQVDVIRIVDIATGASTEHAFNVSGTSPTQSLETIPTEFTFTGPDTATCGTGSADFFVFGGQTPYTAVSTDASIQVTPRSDDQPGKFTVSATNPNKCVTATIIVTDARGGHTTVEVKTEAGSAAPPPPPMSATPNSITLDCGQSGSVLVTGGSGTYSASSTDPNISTALSGNVLTITRAGLPPALAPNINSIVNVTDGTSTINITVSNPQTCS